MEKILIYRCKLSFESRVEPFDSFWVAAHDLALEKGFGGDLLFYNSREVPPRRQYLSLQVKIIRAYFSAGAFHLQGISANTGGWWLFGSLKHRICTAPALKTFINIHAALAAIELRSAGFLHTSRRFSAFGSGSIDLGRVNIIADAMYHAPYIG